MFYYCSKTVLLLLVKVAFSSTVLFLVASFDKFRMTVLHTFHMVFHRCWDRVENYVFCASNNMQKSVCNIYCREFEAVIYFLHHCVRARLRAMLHLLPP